MIRTINGALKELKREDPDSPVSEYALRLWIRTGALPAVRSGNKILVNMETLHRFLSGELNERGEQ